MRRSILPRRQSPSRLVLRQFNFLPRLTYGPTGGSTWHRRSRIKAAAGVAPLTYLSNWRMRIAEQKLCETSAPVATLASSCVSAWQRRLTANPGRSVRLAFLTTSPVGKEQKNALSDRPGIAAWQQITGVPDIEEVRTALCARFIDGPLDTFLRTRSSEELRERILNALTFVCGAGDWAEVESAKSGSACRRARMVQWSSARTSGSSGTTSTTSRRP
jgi:hypothetical protein